MVGVMWPIIMFLIGGVPAEMAWSQGKVVEGLTRLSGERAFVSRVSIIVVTREGLLVMRPALGSRIEKRLVGVLIVLAVFVFGGGYFKDGFEGVSRFPNEHSQ